MQPEISKNKFDKEVEQFIRLQDDWRKKGVLCLKIEFPVVQLVYLAHQLKPASVAFAVSIDFSNYDIEPPSVVFIDYLTGDPITVEALGGIGFFQMNTPQAPPGFIVQQIAQPILMQGADNRPFLCIPGIKEYHDHPAHTGNPWLLHRTKGEGSLYFLMEQLYSSCIPYIRSYNFIMNIQLKQFQ